MNLIPLIFISTWISIDSLFKKTEIRLKLIADMLLIVEKGIRGGMYHLIHRYAKSNNKYMKNYIENKKSSYIQYLEANKIGLNELKIY